MSNREQRIERDYVHVLMALARPSQGEKSACIRTVDKGRGDELEMLKARCEIIGGYWRIHRTVNARDVHKALKHLMCTLIQHPEKASYIDSEWRTSLLQSHCIYGDKKFMLDVDTENASIIKEIRMMVGDNFINSHKSPKGYHIITKPFDTRKVCEIDDVSLLRDGYYFIQEVGERI